MRRDEVRAAPIDPMLTGARPSMARTATRRRRETRHWIAWSLAWIRPGRAQPRIQKVMMELKLLSVAARRGGTGPGGGLGRETASEAILARIDRGFEVLNARMEQIERTVEAMRRHASGLEYRVAADLVDIEQSLKVQSAAIESSCTAMSQTNDLVERVVEVLESLQTTVLEQSEGDERSSFAVNY